MTTPFPHRQSAHCESGVTANLLRSGGFEISEALAFGIGSGLFFAHMPFVRVDHLPLTTYRLEPGGIFKRVARRLGVRVKRLRFRNRIEGARSLDEIVSAGTPVGAQVGVFWLPFMPPAFRFHFNAHNLVVYGKSGDDYLISDPVLEDPVICPARDLTRARFAQGPLAPKGHLYYCISEPRRDMVPGAVARGIREVCRRMLRIPLPYFGIRGIRHLAKRVSRLPESFGEESAKRHLGQVIRMQEEIGTGGAGFRFIYAAFLQEAAELLGEGSLTEISGRLTSAGDRWREFALEGARLCKGRSAPAETYPRLAGILEDCARREEEVFRALEARVRP